MTTPDSILTFDLQQEDVETAGRQRGPSSLYENSVKKTRKNKTNTGEQNTKTIQYVRYLSTVRKKVCEITGCWPQSYWKSLFENIDKLMATVPQEEQIHH